MRKATISFTMYVCPSVRMEQLDSHWTDFLEILSLSIFLKNLSRKCKFQSNRTMITVTVHDDAFTFAIVSRSILLEMRNVSDNSCKENKIIHLTFNNVFQNRVVSEIM